MHSASNIDFIQILVSNKTYFLIWLLFLGIISKTTNLADLSILVSMYPILQLYSMTMPQKKAAKMNTTELIQQIIPTSRCLSDGLKEK